MFPPTFFFNPYPNLPHYLLTYSTQFDFYVITTSAKLSNFLVISTVVEKAALQIFDQNIIYVSRTAKKLQVCHCPSYHAATSTTSRVKAKCAYRQTGEPATCSCPCGCYRIRQRCLRY